jgi:hypothetical protein
MCTNDPLACPCNDHGLFKEMDSAIWESFDPSLLNK